MKKAVVTLILLIVAASLMADARFDRSDPEVVELMSLYRLAGFSFPASAFPLNKASLHGYASDLFERDVEPDLAERIRQFAADLNYAPGAIEMGFTGDAGYERFIGGEGRWDENQDVAYLFSRQVPLFDLEMYYRMQGTAGFAARTPLIREYDGQVADNFFIGKSSNPIAVINNFVWMGTFWYTFGLLEMELGRDVLHIGPLKHSLMPSDSLPFVDMLRFRLPVGRLSMDLTYMTMENREAVIDVTPLPPFDFKQNTILAAIHRFEYAWDRLVLGISGNVVYARNQNAFVLADLFPVFSWHQGDITPNNLSVLVDMNVTPLPGLRVALMGGLDDFNANTVGIGDGGVPTIPAYIAGVEYSVDLPFAEAGIYAEVGKTHYLWGNFEENHVFSRAIYRIALDTGARVLPLTSPYGPGAFWAEGDLLFSGILDSADIGLSVAYLEKNPLANLTSTPYEASTAIKNAVPVRTFSIRMPLIFNRFTWLDFHVDPALFIRGSDIWVQADIGLRYRFDRLVQVN